MDPAPPAELGKASAQFGEVRQQRGHILSLESEPGPIAPSDGIVLAVGIVVAVLAVADFVSRQEQRHTLRQHEARQQIAAHLTSHLHDIGIVGRAFDAAIRAVIFIGAVTVVLAVRLIVLALIADQIGKSEPIVDRDVVDARAGTAGVMVEQMRGTRHAAAEVSEEFAVTPPIAPQRAAKLIVPLGPAGRKSAHLIAARAEIPRLGNELYSSQDRILPDRSEKGRTAIEAVRSAAEGGCEIEPESVDSANLDPMAQ